MKVCIVGGTGNISTGIAGQLVAAGHEVVCFNRGQRPATVPGVKHLHGDRHDREAFESLMQEQGFEAAIDMICFTREDAESSLKAFRGVRHFIHCSTVCTYGVEADWLPVSEDHPLRPISDYGRNKVAADNVLLRAWHEEGFPVTILKPSTTYGPQQGALRQVAWEFSWIDRIRRGKPVVVCGDGKTIHQFLHVDDAAVAFVQALGRERCLGQVYNLVPDGFISWVEHHRTAAQALGCEVELVGVPFDTLAELAIERFDLCRSIFAHNGYFCNRKLRRDIPEFSPRVRLVDGLREVIEAMDREGRIPACEDDGWEDRVIAAQRAVASQVLD